MSIHARQVRSWCRDPCVVEATYVQLARRRRGTSSADRGPPRTGTFLRPACAAAWWYAWSIVIFTTKTHDDAPARSPPTSAPRPRLNLAPWRGPLWAMLALVPHASACTADDAPGDADASASGVDSDGTGMPPPAVVVAQAYTPEDYLTYVRVFPEVPTGDLDFSQFRDRQRQRKRARRPHLRGTRRNGAALRAGGGAALQLGGLRHPGRQCDVDGVRLLARSRTATLTDQMFCRVAAATLDACTDGCRASASVGGESSPPT